MTTSAVTALATAMRQRIGANRDGYQSTRRSDGLELILSRNDTVWTLTAQRTDAYPSSQELASVRAAFGVPDEPAVKPFTRSFSSPRTGAKITYHGYRLEWREI